MYFDFEDNHPDIQRIGRALSPREGALVSIIIHLLAIIVVILNPKLPGADAAKERLQEQLALQRERERQDQRFVFIQPRLDRPAPAPPRRDAPASDKDRLAQTRERPPNPTNTMPYARGNTPERVEALARPEPAPPTESAPPPPEVQPGNSGQGRDGNEGAFSGPAVASGGLLAPPSNPARGRGSQGTGEGTGILGRALRDLDRYVRQETFDNQGGGDGQFGPSIQFDSKGVEFGPWIRRFIAQIKRNWFIPYAAMAMRGHVVVTFYVMKDGRILELGVPGPSSVEAFNNAAFNALAASNPTHPLPPEYPADRAHFTVTFYYNETPPGGPGGS